MSGKIKNLNKFIILFTVGFIFLFSDIFSQTAEAAGASLYLAPSRSSFFVGSTFSVSIYVDTKGNKINAVEVDLKFPQDILQITSPTTGESFISEWIVPPNYSNIGGVISFKGGIPGGVITSAGLISTITFRAKSTGLAKIEISDSSRVLLADGKGTPISTTNFNGIYEILIPPPEGPKINSPTHPDAEIWYSDSNPTFCWEKEEGATEFSYSFSQNPLENPDTISEGIDTCKNFENVADGIWYFNLRAKKEGVWGKTSHFGIRIDTTPPQKFEFRIEVNPGFIYFKTEDLHSRIDHYEISLVSLEEILTPAPFFVEGTSPFRIPSKSPGKYSIAIRAFDKAGNYQEVESKFQIISPNISFVSGKGIQIKRFFFPWLVIYLILFVLVIGLSYFIFYLFQRKMGFKKGLKEISEALTEIRKIEEREKETQRLREKFEEERKKLEEKLK